MGNFIFTCVLGLLIALSESWSAWMIWQLKLRSLWPALDPYVSLPAIFYLNIAVSVCLRSFNHAARDTNTDELMKRFGAHLAVPFVVVALVWVLAKAGF